jgi:hypothetical protein
MTSYEERIRASHATLDAHEALVKKIVADIAKYESVGPAHARDEEEHRRYATPWDFRPILKAYAQSKDLHPLLLESQSLFDDVVPTILHQLIGEDQSLDTCCPESIVWEDVSSAHRKWVHYEAEYNHCKIPMYSHKEFVKLAKKS